MNYKETKTALEEACDAYYNKTPIITDVDFDLMKDEFERMYPSDSFLSKIEFLIISA